LSVQGVNGLINSHSHRHPLYPRRRRNGPRIGFTGFWGFWGSLARGRLSYGLKNDLISECNPYLAIVIISTTNTGARKLDPLAINVLKSLRKARGLHQLLTISQGSLENGLPGFGGNGLSVANVGGDGTLDPITGIY
jgi:hypothetical protein